MVYMANAISLKDRWHPPRGKMSTWHMNMDDNMDVYPVCANGSKGCNDSMGKCQ